MPLVLQSPQITDLDQDQEKFRYIQLCLQGILSVVNGNVEFFKNIKGQAVNVSFSATNSDTECVHNLGYSPSGYLVYRRSANMTIYDGNGAIDRSVFSLRSSAIGTASVLFF